MGVFDKHRYMSHFMRKQTICICVNKDADQLRVNREADQRLCFRNMYSTFLYFLNPKCQASLSRACSETTLLVFS